MAAHRRNASSALSGARIFAPGTMSARPEHIDIVGTVIVATSRIILYAT